VLQEAHTELANGGPGVAAMIASPDQIIAVAHNSIPETGDFNQPCGNGLVPSSRAAAARNVRAGPHYLRCFRTVSDVRLGAFYRRIKRIVTQHFQKMQMKNK
jgi:hypothetical protein